MGGVVCLGDFCVLICFFLNLATLATFVKCGRKKKIVVRLTINSWLFIVSSEVINQSGPEIISGYSTIYNT